MADSDLSEILSGRDVSAQPRDEHGRFAPVDSAPPAEPEKTPEPAPTPAPVAPVEAAPAVAEPVAAPQMPRQIPEAALLDERRKRQEYERKLAELEQRMAQLQAPPPAAPAKAEPPADFWSDPQGFIEAQMQQARQAALSEAEVRMRHQFAEVCELNARTRYADYDEVRDAFLARVEQDPVLRAELSQARDPAEFAYKTGKRLSEVEQFGSLDQWREQERARIRAELEAQFKPQAPAVPQSLNAEPSPAVSSPHVESFDKSLAQILQRK
jgi:hypothetical protein